MDFRRTLIILCSLFLPTNFLQLKLGVLVPYNESMEYKPYRKCFQINGHIPVVADISWTFVKEKSLYDIVQNGETFLKTGISFLFLIHNSTRHFVYPEWLLPLVGIGNLDKYLERNYSKICGTILSNEPYQRDSEDRYPFHLQGQVFSKILLSVIDSLQWNHAIVFYSEDTEFVINGLFQEGRVNSLLFTMYLIDEVSGNEDRIHSFLLQVYESSRKKLSVIFVSGTKKMRQLMTEVNDFDNVHIRQTAMGFVSKWMLIHIDDKPLEDVNFLSNLNNVAILNLPLSSAAIDLPPFLTLEYIIDNIANGALFNNNGSTTCYNETSIFRLKANIWKCILQTKKDYAKSVPLTIKTLMFYENGRQWADVGRATLTGEVTIHSKIFPNVNHGLNGKRFIVTTLEYYPFEYLVHGTWHGISIELLNAMSTKLNFTYDITQPVDGEWGTLKENSSWTGMVGQLQRREVDLAAAPITIQSKREESVDFTLAFFFDIMVILSKKPDPKKTQWLRILEPLRWEVVVLTTSFLSVITLLIYSSERVNPFYALNSRKKSFIDTFCYAYGCLFMQGGRHLPMSSTGRTLLCCWWLFCIILSATYCGNLIAFLTVNKEKMPFETLTELVQQDHYEWGTLGGTFWVTWFQYSTIPTLHSIWMGITKFNQSDPRVLSTSVSKHIEKVKEGGYAYMAEKSILTMESSKDCDLQIAREEFFPQQFAFGLPNNSPYTKMLSDIVLKMHETGFLQIWKNQHWPTDNQCDDSVITEAKQIHWIDIQTVFYILGCGIVVATLILCLEYLWRICRYKRICKRSK